MPIEIVLDFKCARKNHVFNTTALVFPATQEAEVGELLEHGRTRL